MVAHAEDTIKTKIDVVEKIESLDFNPESLSKEEKNSIKQLFSDPLEESLDNTRLITKLNNKKIEVAKRYGMASYEERVFSRKEKDAVVAHIEGVGFAEVKVIGSGDKAVTVDKIVNEKTGRTYVIVDFAKLPLNHLEVLPEDMGKEEFQKEMRMRKYLAFHIRSFLSKQLIFGGNNRDISKLDKEMAARHVRKILNQDADRVVETKDWHSIVKQPGSISGMDMEGNPFGHDVTLILVNEGKKVRTEFHRAPRSKAESSFWSNYYRAIYEHPEFNETYWEQGGFNKLKILFTGDIAIGWVFAGLQVAAVAGLGFLDVSMNDPAHSKEIWLEYKALGVSSLSFGLLFGVYTRTFQNWYLDHGKATWLSRDAKAWAVALSYGFTFSFLSSVYLNDYIANGGVLANGQTQVAAITPWAFAVIVSNILIKGWFKRWSLENTRYDKASGESLGRVIIPNRIKIDKLMVNWKLFDKPIKTGMQKSGVQVQWYQLLGTIPKLAYLADMRVNVPGIGVVPIGILMYPAMIPVFHAWAMKRAEAYVGTHSRIKGPAAKNIARKLYPDIELSDLTGRQKLEILKLTSKKYSHYKLRDTEKLAIEYRELWEAAKFGKVPYLKLTTVGAFDFLVKSPYRMTKTVLKEGPAWTKESLKKSPGYIKTLLGTTNRIGSGALKKIFSSSGPTIFLLAALNQAQAQLDIYPRQDLSIHRTEQYRYEMKPPEGKNSCRQSFR